MPLSKVKPGIDDNSDATAITIDSSENVGIGETAPVTPLTIATANKLGATFTGNTNGEGLTVTQTDYTSGNYISLIEAAYDDSNDANPNVRIGAMFDGGGSNLAFGTSNSYGSGITNTAMFVDSIGNVGIGTNSVASGGSNTTNFNVHTPAATSVYLKLSNSSTGNSASDGLDLSQDSSGNAYFINRENGFSSFWTNATERMRILSTGGITFNGDTAAANALDDYEEGNFTVTIASGISVSSYDHQIGHYVKVGRMVTAWVFMEYNGSSRTSSHFIISGLPFTSSNDTSNEATMGGFITYQNNFSNAYNIIHVARNNTKAFFYELDGSDLIGSELSGASGEVRFVVQYTVA